MSLISVSNLSFSYEGSYDSIFSDVSFNIDTSWRLGFIGRNGKGKTTFLNLLLGKYDYKGSIKASVDFEYFPYDVGDTSQLTGDIIRQKLPDYIEWELMRELSLLKVSKEVLERPFNTLSNGEGTKILLAVLFLKENSFLLIDEPTNHLDANGRRLVGDYLRSKSGFILVSHDRAFLDGCIDHVLSINKANIEVQRGNFSSFLENKERKDNYELMENERLKKDIDRLKTAASRVANWSDRTEKGKYAGKNGSKPADRGFIGHKAAKVMKRSKEIDQRRQREVEEKSGLLKNVDFASELKIKTLEFHKKRLIELLKVSINYGEKTVCKDVSFVVEKGDRIALDGGNGSGKSSIIKLICGEEIEYTGSLSIGTGLEISYVSQDTSHLRGGLDSYAAEEGIDEGLFKTILRKLDFSKIQFEKEMQSFSEGQKKKVLIAGSLCKRAHLLVWDEPLNFIDVISRIQIEELLLRFKPTIIFVEHDVMFKEKIASKTVEL